MPKVSSMKKYIAASGMVIAALTLFSFRPDAGVNAGFKSADPRPAVNLIHQDSTQWIQLFNGKDLTGWKHVGPGSMSVENGLIRGHGGMGLLYWAAHKVGHCTIKVVFRMKDSNDNSGVFIRIPIEPKEEWMPVFYGYEVQIDNHPETSNEDEYHITGTLYSLTKPLAKPGKPGPQWNTMEITIDGPHTIIVVHGEKVTDYRDGAAVPRSEERRVGNECRYRWSPYH